MQAWSPAMHAVLQSTAERLTVGFFGCEQNVKDAKYI